MMDLALTGAEPLSRSLMVTAHWYCFATCTNWEAGRAWRPVGLTMETCLETITHSFRLTGEGQGALSN